MRRAGGRHRLRSPLERSGPGRCGVPFARVSCAFSDLHPRVRKHKSISSTNLICKYRGHAFWTAHISVGYSHYLLRERWAENDRGVSYVFGPDIVTARFACCSVMARCRSEHQQMFFDPSFPNLCSELSCFIMTDVSGFFTNRSYFLQSNTQVLGFFKIYNICNVLHRANFRK